MKAWPRITTLAVRCDRLPCFCATGARRSDEVSSNEQTHLVCRAIVDSITTISPLSHSGRKETAMNTRTSIWQGGSRRLAVLIAAVLVALSTFGLAAPADAASGNIL